MTDLDAAFAKFDRETMADMVRAWTETYVRLYDDPELSDAESYGKLLDYLTVRLQEVADRE